MNIKSIGKYCIMSDYNWKQIYSPHNRMLQINHTATGDKLSYVDTHKMCTIREYVRKIFWSKK